MKAKTRGKLLYFFIGIVFTVFLTISLFKNRIDKNNYETGKTVLVEVISKPNTCGDINSRTSFLKLSYNGKIFSKKIGNWYCEFLDNEKIQVVITKSQDKIFYLDEDFEEQLIYIIILFIIPILLFYYGVKYKIEIK